MKIVLRSALVCMAVFCLSLETMAAAFPFSPVEPMNAAAGSPKTRKYKRTGRYPKYSKKWWRQYRARVKRHRALQSRRRALRLRQLRAAVKKNNTASGQGSHLLPSGQPVPAGWRRSGSSGNEFMYSVEGVPGSASIAVVGPATGETVDTGWKRAVGGVSTTTLRRQVIDQMVRENGWVVNDYQKEIGGRSVYVVAAESQARGGSVQTRMFYFTEADGRIYSIATNSSVDATARIAAESEKMILSLRPRSSQQAAIRE